MKNLNIYLLLIFVLCSIYIFQPSAYQTLKLKTFDAFVTEQEPSNYFTILNITEEDIAREGGYPLSRQTLAQIQINLLRKGAIGVGWVIAFPQPDRFGGDLEFSEALSFSPSVLAMFEGKGEYPPTTGTVILGDDIGGIKAQGVIQNIKVLKQNSSQGLAVARTEVDNLVRRLPLLMRTNDGWVASYGTEVLKVLAGADTYVIKTNDNGIEEIRVRGLPPVKVDSLGRKWISWVDTPQTNLAEMDVENKFVFVGFTAKGIMPQIAVPNNKLLEPHKIQAALAESILIENSPYIPDYSLLVELLFTFISLCLVISLINVLGITFGISASSLVIMGTALSGYYLIQNGLLIDVTWSLLSQFISASTAFYLRFREQYKLRQQIKGQFGKYLDPRMVKKLQDNPELCQVNGKRVDCSIIFTDLRGFTSLSESVEPEMVTYIMNAVLDAQVEAANKYFGCTDKFIGDAGMFHWNTIIPQDDHHNLALQAAKEIESNIDRLNLKFKEEGIPEVAIGIGVNSGVCIAGNFGATDRFAFSLIGDPCNVAARLESSTKVAGVGVLIGEETAKHSKFAMKLLDPIEVKGKAKPLQVYTWE